ncbi:MAG TPA: GNAT family N-acetyltransferase [Polyangiaceae bacterium]|nr:GNAT family N-acetyltransferase [Polyangiaceae bacterium]
MTDFGRIADQIEADAWTALFDAMPSPMKSALGARVERIGGVTVLLAPGIPLSYFNRAIGLGMSSEVQEEDVGSLAELFEHAGCPASNIHLAPYARAHGDIRGWLAAAGYALLPTRPTWGKFLRGPEACPVIQTELEVEPAEARDAAAVAAVLCDAHGMPPSIAPWTAALVASPRLRTYRVLDGDAVVGGALLYSSGNRAWLGLGGVLPSHRRRGAQKALMRRRIVDAARLGAEHLATETGEPLGEERNPSFSNMLAMGFRKVMSRENWTR